MDANVGTVSVRRLAEPDVEAADRVMRTAFGTYLGFTPPDSFGGDGEFVRTRARARHTAGFVAEDDGVVVGSCLVSRWGSFAVLGPLTVDPAHWDAGIGRRLMEPAVDQLDAWSVRLAGLFTFPNSPKHIGLYHRYGFYPRTLTALMQHRVTRAEPARAIVRLSTTSPNDRGELLRQLAAVSDAVYAGLDLTAEIEELAGQRLGDVVVVEDGGDPAGFALCHLGAGSEAGSNTCYVKFAVVRLAHGYRAGMYGLAMHRPNHSGFSRREDYVLDDWR